MSLNVEYNGQTIPIANIGIVSSQEKLLLGNLDRELVLQTLGKITIQSGGMFYDLKLDSSGNISSGSNNVFFIDSLDNFLSSNYTDGSFIFDKSNKSLYLISNNSLVLIAGKADTDNIYLSFVDKQDLSGSQKKQLLYNAGSSIPNLDAVKDFTVETTFENQVIFVEDERCHYVLNIAHNPSAKDSWGQFYIGKNGGIINNGLIIRNNTRENLLYLNGINQSTSPVFNGVKIGNESLYAKLSIDDTDKTNFKFRTKELCIESDVDRRYALQYKDKKLGLNGPVSDIYDSIIYGNTKVDNSLTIGNEVNSTNFVSTNITHWDGGSGFRLRKNNIDKWVMELDDLIVRGSIQANLMSIKELKVERAYATGGHMLITDGAIVDFYSYRKPTQEEVTNSKNVLDITKNYYFVIFKNSKNKEEGSSAYVGLDPAVNDRTTIVDNSKNLDLEKLRDNNYCPFLAGDILLCQTVSGDITKKYYTLVTYSTNNYIVIGDTDFRNNYIPEFNSAGDAIGMVKEYKLEIGDELARIGNIDHDNNPLIYTKQDRRKLIDIDGTRNQITMFDNIGSADMFTDELDPVSGVYKMIEPLGKSNLKLRMGKLDDLGIPIGTDIHGLKHYLSGYGLYADNVYLKGRMIIKYDDESEHAVGAQRGVWSNLIKTTYYMNDLVSYLGSIYRCVIQHTNIPGTSPETPGKSNVWELWISKTDYSYDTIELNGGQVFRELVEAGIKKYSPENIDVLCNINTYHKEDISTIKFLWTIGSFTIKEKIYNIADFPNVISDTVKIYPKGLIDGFDWGLIWNNEYARTLNCETTITTEKGIISKLTDMHSIVKIKDAVDSISAVFSNQNMTMPSSDLGQFFFSTDTTKPSTQVQLYKGLTLVDIKVGNTQPISYNMEYIKGSCPANISINNNSIIVNSVDQVLSGSEYNNQLVDIPITINIYEFGVKITSVIQYIHISAIKQAPNILWVKDWDSKGVDINGTRVASPRIFAGSVTNNTYVTGVAIGRQALSMVDDANSIGINALYNNQKVFTLQCSTGELIIGAKDSAVGNIAKGNYMSFNPTKGLEISMNGRSANPITGYIYIRGTGYNRNAANELKIEDIPIYNSTGRGLTLCIINRETLKKTENHIVYDTYGDINATNALIAKLATINDDTNFITLSSYDVISITKELADALAVFGGSKFTVNQDRLPYIFIGYKGLPSGSAIEQYTSNGSVAPYAETTIKIVDKCWSGASASASSLFKIANDNITLQVSGVTEKVNSVAEDVTGLKSDIKTTNETVSKISVETGKISSRVSGTETSIITVKDDVTGLEKKVISTNSTVADLSVTVGTVSATVTKNDKIITSLNLTEQGADFIGKEFVFRKDGEESMTTISGGRLTVKGAITQSPSGVEFPFNCFRGEYIVNTTYYKGDEVTYLGQSYIYYNDTSTQNLPTNTTYWKLKAAKGADGISGGFKSTVFIRSNTQPSAPSGGTYFNPIPSGWSDGVPTGDAILWSSSSTFKTTTVTPIWSTPASMTDTATVTFRYSSVLNNPGTPSTIPNNWSSTASETTIWLAIQETKNGIIANWVISKIKGEKGEDGIAGNFKSTAFLRTNSEPATPSGGSYLNPTPNGWFDGIPVGGEKLWSSVALFTPNGVIPAWSKPSQMTDTTTISYQYSSVAINPGNPDSSSGNWSSVADVSTIWMAVRTITNAIPSTWQVSKIKGEQGEIGIGGNFKSTVFKRCNLKPSTPIGGTYDIPVPTGWNDGAPDGEEILWASSATFSPSGIIGEWSEPASMTNTATTIFKYSSVASGQGNPDTNPTNWGSTASESTIWMAIREVKNGINGSWQVSKIKGERGQGIPGDPGADGRTPYFHIAYADTVQGGGFSQDPTNKLYMGTYTDFNIDNSSDPTKYTWAKFKGDKGDTGERGLQGLQGDKGDKGIAGEKGADGKTTYTHIAYADDVQGNGFSQQPTNKACMGVYVDNIELDSNDRTKYKWSVIKGAQGEKGDKGVAGAAGSDGRTPYFHIAYADNAQGGGFSQLADGKEYIGTYTDYTEGDSSDVSRYTWVKVKGADGKDAGVNLLNWQEQWKEGALPAGWELNGLPEENSVIYGENPFKVRSLMWKCKPNLDGNAAGGYHTPSLLVDSKYAHRFSTFVFRVRTGNGSVYHGCFGLDDLNDTENGNPYFWSGDLPATEWFLMVGYIHPKGSVVKTNLSGVYNMQGKKIAEGSDFKFRQPNLYIKPRNYLYYSNMPDAEVYFYNPMLHKLDGTEPSIEQMLQLSARKEIDAVKATSEAYAAAQAELARVTAEANSDGKITAAEARAITDATNKANAARDAAITAAAADASAKIDAVKTTYDNKFENTAKQFVSVLIETKTYADNAVAGVQVGGVNLVTNSSYLTFNSNMNGSGISILKNDEPIPYYRAISDNDKFISLYGALTFLQKGKEYMVSIDVRCPNDGMVRLYASEADYNGAIDSILKANEWTRIKTRVVIGGGNKSWVIISATENNVKQLDYRRLQIERGNKATDWTAAPEDVSADAQAYADKVAKKAADAAATAQAKADSASLDASNANSRLADWASDSYISPTEKVAMRQLQLQVTNDRLALCEQAGQYNVNSNVFVSVYNDYNTQLTNHTATTPENIQISALLSSTQLAYNNARIALTKAIAVAAKADAQTKADNAKSDAIAQAQADAAKNYTAKTEFESSIDQLAGQITSKVSQTDYNALGERVKKAESSIQQTPDAINLAVKKLTVGTRNYIPASKFNTQESVAQVKGWTVRTWGLANDAIKGNVLKVDADGCFLPFTNKGFSVGDEVTLLFSIRADSNYSMFFQICNPDGANKWSYGDISLTTEWQKISIVIKVPPKITIESSQVIYFYPKIPCYIEYVTLNKGNVPAAWQPADEDADSQYSLIRQEFNSINLSTNEKVDGQNKVLASFGLTGENIEAKAKNFGLDKEGNAYFAGKVDAKSGSIGGFELADGRIGSSDKASGDLTIYEDFFSVGNQNGYVMFGGDTIPLSAGGAIKSTGRIYNKGTKNSLFPRKNYGLMFDVSGADKNYAASSNAPFVAPAFIQNRLQTLDFNKPNQNLDFTSYNIFNIIPAGDVKILLPDKATLESLFDLSVMPEDFALPIKIMHTTRNNYKMTIPGWINSGGGWDTATLWSGGVINLIATNENGFAWRVA